jgi:hypothetical protein
MDDDARTGVCRGPERGVRRDPEVAASAKAVGTLKDTAAGRQHQDHVGAARTSSSSNRPIRRSSTSPNTTRRTVYTTAPTTVVVQESSSADAAVADRP